MAEMFKVTVNGQEREVDRAELIRGYQIRAASQQQYEEAKALRQQAEAQQALLRDNPAELLNHPELGPAVMRAAIERLEQQIALEAMNPDARRAMQEQQQREALQRRNQELEQQISERESQQLTAQWAEHFEGVTKQILETSGLPKTPQTITKVAQALEYTLPPPQGMGLPLTPEQIAAMVRQSYMEDLQAVIGPFDGAKLEQFLGDKAVQMILKNGVEKAKKAGAAVEPTTQALPPTGPRNGTPKIRTDEDWNAAMRRHLNGQG